eukprot:TRINITY_DN14614_c0_g1_i2.p1 TRINITY_DN14614_c0_g1~~TRINITY_DN14614_c0_g1_i2.p1  ORF type:complete len:1114 (-),score=273.33 TRINITY_DN14614_c0_g1_i2:232-3573(-)
MITWLLVQAVCTYAARPVALADVFDQEQLREEDLEVQHDEGEEWEDDESDDFDHPTGHGRVYRRSGHLHEILDFHEHSFVWNAVAKTLSHKLMRNAEQHDAGNSSAFLQLDAEQAQMLRREKLHRDALRSHLEASAGGQLGEQLAAELRGEHVIVQRAVQSALGLGEVVPKSDEKKEKVLACASILGQKGKQGGGMEPVNATVQKEDAFGALASNKATEEKTDGIFDDMLHYLKETYKAGKLFVTDFIRWEIWWWVFGFDVDALPTFPNIGFKCQPILKCVKLIGQFAGNFVKFLGHLFWAFMRAIGALLKTLARWVGLSGKTKESIMADLQPKPAEKGAHDEEFANIELPEGGFDDKDLKTLKVNNQVVVGDLDTLFKDCRSEACDFRIKGGFQAGPNFATSVALLVSTMAMPLAGAGKACYACMTFTKEFLKKIFIGTSNKFTEEYFKPGICHAHTVGMCMMLEKVRACGFTLPKMQSLVAAGGAFPTGPLYDADKHGSQSQKSFCQALNGVSFDITAIRGEPRCPEKYKRWMKEERHRRVSFKKDKIQRMYLDQGCSHVLDSLQRYNRKCESDEAKGFFSKISWTTRRWAQKMGSFTYKNAIAPESGKEASAKCKAIFGCTGNFLTGRLRRRVDLQDLKARIEAIIDQVDDYGEAPQSYSPVKATDMVVNLAQTVSASLDGYEQDVSDSAELEEYPKTPWQDDNSNVLADEIWDDECFQNKHSFWSFKKLRDKVHQANKDLFDKYDPWKGDFFYQLGQYMGISNWTGDVCLVHKAVVARPAPQRIRATGPKVVLFMPADPDEWKNMWNKGKLDFPAMSLEDEAGEGIGLRLVQLKDGWYLASCAMGADCNGVARGTRLQSIRIKYAAGPVIKKFMTSTRTLMSSAYKLNQLALNKPEFVAYRAAAEHVEAWIDAIASKKSKLFNRTYLEKLHARLGAKELKQFCAERGWAFTKKQKDGFSLLYINGSPLQRIRQLRTMAVQLRKPAFTALHNIQAAVQKTGRKLLRGTDAKSVYPRKAENKSAFLTDELVAELKQNPDSTVVKMTLSFEPFELQVQCSDRDGLGWLLRFSVSCGFVQLLRGESSHVPLEQTKEHRLGAADEDLQGLRQQR